MTLLCDSNEPVSIQRLIEQSVPCERMLLNRPAVPSRPDYGFYTWDGRYAGISRKQAGEFLGDIAAAESQLAEEMVSCDFMALLIEGWWEPVHGNQTRSWRYGRTGQTAHPQHTYHQGEVGVRAKLTRLQDMGVMIVQTANEMDTALTLVAMHDALQKPDAEMRTFLRLAGTKRWIAKRLNDMLLTDEERTQTPEVQHTLVTTRRRFAELLCALDGVGDEVSVALAREFPSFASLWSWLEEPGGEARLAAIPLESGRRIGPALIRRMKGQLGL